VELLIAVLVAACSGAIVGLSAVEGLRRRRRTDALGRDAHGRGVRFAVEDPINMPKRYRRFAIMRAGHDLAVRNVCDSPSPAGRGRTFDLHFDVGRGRRRERRHYAVAAVELAHGVTVAGERFDAGDGRINRPAAGALSDSGVERIGRVVLAHGPMSQAPGDHRAALERLLKIVSDASGDAPSSKCCGITIENPAPAR